LSKTLFVKYFEGNTCKFYNVVENNYPQRNYLPIKILGKNGRKKSFFANFSNIFARKISCNMRIYSSDYDPIIYLKFLICFIFYFILFCIT